MTKLLATQNQLQNYLFTGQVDIANKIVSTETVPAEVRLTIYRHAYFSRLTEALASHYPVLKQYLDVNQFEQIAREYIHQYPSQHKSIRWFGDQFSTFLQNHYDYHAHSYLAELASFEWTQTLVFDAADSASLQIKSMVTLSPDEWASMRLRPHPSLHRINLSWNTVALWEAVLNNESPPEPVKNHIPIPWIVWRKDWFNRFSSLPDDEAWAMDAMLCERSFGDICEGLCQWVSEEEAGQRAASLLKTWIQLGLLAEVVL